MLAAPPGQVNVPRIRSCIRLGRCRGSQQPVYIYMPVWYSICSMKRTALFLKEQQLEKLQKLSEKTGAPVAELIRRAIDKYLHERAKELK